ncbi:MAG: Holliday junction resolvase RuvX [Armatimonadetes bacterium]|nr:Holliday junction resolvase RuvX [Armatimonadota bacterium]
MLGEKIVLAIDPGSSKCGMALVRRDGAGELDLIWKSIVSTDNLVERIESAREEDEIHLLVIGNGTRSRPIVEELRDKLPGLGILVVDEKDTTMQARERYWQYHPRKGLWKFIPSTLRTPRDPVDDFVALILAERVLKA